MRLVAGVRLAAAVLLGGCAGWSQTPYNPQQACDIVGGMLTADGRCLAGNS
jgi:hypothetical protein